MTESSEDVLKFAHANLPSDPKKSVCFHVPEYMHKPQVYLKFGHQIRIWRTQAVNLLKTNDLRRCVGLLEWTNLETGLTLGLKWYYSLYQKQAWKEFKYILYSWFPGEQPCKDLNDVYKSTTAEIKWVVARLRRDYEKNIGKSLIPREPVGVFPK